MLARRIGIALAAGVSFACYVATLSGASYWLDAGEFVAASFRLGISHPPGHPLSQLYGRAVQCVPLGSLAARAAWGQAVASAFAAACLYRAIECTLRAALPGRDGVATSAALMGTWLASLSYGWWFQAVRPEVYALETALLCLAIERLVAFEVARVEAPEGETGGAGRPRDARALYVAACALGLGLTNHHFMAVLVFPAFLWTVLRAVRTRGRRLFLGVAVAGALPLLVYAYLPARAAANPPENPGVPTSVERFLWLVSARVYREHTGATSWQPLDERFADMAVIIVEHTYGIFALCAVCGLYLLCRRRATRGVGVAWGLVSVLGFGARAYLDPVRGNPDALGYLGPAFAATSALAAAFVGVAGSVVSEAIGARAVQALPALVAALAVGVGAEQGIKVAKRASLAAFQATDVFGAERMAALPSRAVVIATTPHWLFRHWEHEAAEDVRPDVTIVPVPLLAYPGTAEAFVARHPDLADPVAAYAAGDRLDIGSLERLAVWRPVLVELDMRTSPELYGRLVPDHLLHRVVAGAESAAVLAGAGAQRAQYARLYARLGGQSRERETSRALLWMHYLDALYYAARGHRGLAREAFAFAASLHPADAHLRALGTALAGAETGPIDVRPFLDGTPPDAAH